MRSVSTCISIFFLLATAACNEMHSSRAGSVPATVAAVHQDRMTLQTSNDYIFVAAEPQENLRARLHRGDSVMLLRDATGEFAAIELADGSRIQLD